MLVVEPEAIAAVPQRQTEADVVALQSIDLRILCSLTERPLEEGWAAAADIAADLGAPHQTIAWRPIGRLKALELIETHQMIGLASPHYRITARGAAAAELVRNPSAASKEVRAHLRFIAPPTPEPVVA